LDKIITENQFVIKVRLKIPALFFGTYPCQPLPSPSKFKNHRDGCGSFGSAQDFKGQELLKKIKK
jgi:hypothetical protein